VSISDSGTESDGSSVDDEPIAEEWEDDEQRLIRQGGNGIPIGEVCPIPFAPHLCGLMAVKDGTPRPLLPAISSQYLGRKCLVLDLDETLVHSSLRVRAIQSSWLHICSRNDVAARTFARLYCASRDREQLAQFLCAQTAGRRELPAQDGRALRDCRLHGESCQVCRPSAGQARSRRHSGSQTLPRELLQSSRQLCQGKPALQEIHL
jgi:hypothetical protein